MPRASVRGFGKKISPFLGISLTRGAAAQGPFSPCPPMPYLSLDLAFITLAYSVEVTYILGRQRSPPAGRPDWGFSLCHWHWSTRGVSSELDGYSAGPSLLVFSYVSFHSWEGPFRHLCCWAPAPGPPFFCPFGPFI
jgi:hypothetical protein